jgi:two-component system, OmpR family, sensor kinase
VEAISLRARLLLALAYVLVLAVVALEVPLALSVSRRVDAEVSSQAREQAELVAASVVGHLGQDATLARVADAAAATVRGRVIVVDRRGTVLADSSGTAALGADYASRPEIAGALRGHVEQVRRRSITLGRGLLATAWPIVHRGRVVGAVRVTQDIGAVSRATRQAVLGLVLIGLVVLLLGLGAGWVIARQIAGPVRRLDRTARLAAEGDLTVRARIEGSTEQRRLAATFNEMTARVERLLTVQRDFVADASHELRTPLSGLRLRLEEVRAASPDPAVVAEVDAALCELDRLAGLVGSLLELSQAGEVDAPTETVDLAAAAEAAAERWDGIDGAHVRAIVSGPAPGRCPPAELAHALDALVENAVRYGGGDVTVHAEPGVLEVRDRGPGLDPEELDAVFERFHRGRAARSGAPGTGLGLAIARELARRWGGEVELVNRPEGGAVARLSVPVAPLVAARGTQGRRDGG